MAMVGWVNFNAFTARTDYFDVAGQASPRQPIQQKNDPRCRHALVNMIEISPAKARSLVGIALLLALQPTSKIARAQSPVQAPPLTQNPESLAEKLRSSRPDAVESSDLRSPELRDDETTDSLRTEAGKQSETMEVDESESTLRGRATMAHLIQLRKPIRLIELADASNDQPKPEDRPAWLVDSVPAVVVTAIGYGVPIPNRYTICQSHQPLYFEQPNLERCGNGFGVWQNAVSGATFLTNTILLPYKIGKQRPDCEVLAGGDCKTCQSVPVGSEVLPVDGCGVANEVLAVAALSLLLL